MIRALWHWLRGHDVQRGIDVRRFGIFWPRAWWCRTDGKWLP
jgi:hypothetical protein